MSHLSGRPGAELSAGLAHPVAPNVTEGAVSLLRGSRVKILVDGGNGDNGFLAHTERQGQREGGREGEDRRKRMWAQVRRFIPF